MQFTHPHIYIYTHIYIYISPWWDHYWDNHGCWSPAEDRCVYRAARGDWRQGLAFEGGGGGRAGCSWWFHGFYGWFNNGWSNGIEIELRWNGDFISKRLLDGEFARLDTGIWSAETGVLSSNWGSCSPIWRSRNGGSFVSKNMRVHTNRSWVLRHFSSTRGWNLQDRGYINQLRGKPIGKWLVNALILGHTSHMQKQLKRSAKTFLFFRGGTWAYRHGEVGWDDSWKNGTSTVKMMISNRQVKLQKGTQISADVLALATGISARNLWNITKTSCHLPNPH